MISFVEVEQLHKLLIDNFGGSHGIRDKAALESAISRPFQTFDNNDLYPTVIDKAASLIESMLINHPFIDDPIHLTLLTKDYSKRFFNSFEISIKEVLNKCIQQTHLCYWGLTQSVVQLPVRFLAFCPTLTFPIKQQDMFCSLVLRSAAVAGGNE